MNFELGEWGFCAVVWSICELGIPSSRGSIRTIFGEPRWGGEPRRGLRPGKFGKYGKSFAKRRQPASGRPKARVIPRNQHGVPPPTSRQFNQNKTAPGNSVRGGDCAPEAAACKGLGTASLRPHVQTSRSKLQGRGCSGRDDELRFRRPPLSENALV